jgi:hypothetical protein
MAVSNEQLMALLAATNPELAPVLSLLTSMTDAPEEPPKRKRRPSAYNRAYSRAYQEIKKKHTLKSGKMAKGWAGKAGHLRIVDLAHKAARKEMKK